MFIGHDRLLKRFNVLAKRNELSQGYLFFGERQTGKFTFACHVAFVLEKTEPFLDASIVSPNDNGNIEIDAIREVKSFLATRPFRSARKTVIIDEAEKLSPSAQSAFLKIVEEPPSSALILMITADPDFLLPALVSRFQKIYFPRVKEKEIADWLDSLNVSDEMKIKAVNNCFGRPGLARDIAFGATLQAEKIARDFFNGGQALERVIDDEKLLDRVLEFLIVKARNDGNWPLVKSLLSRLRVMKQFNVNKRLQLEAI